MRLSSTTLTLAALGLLTLGIVVASLYRGKAVELATLAGRERSKLDETYGTDKSSNGYQAFVNKWKSSPDQKVQDQVGAARLRLAFMAAGKKDFGVARAIFKEAEEQYKGTGAVGADFGGIPDQAAYQAAVCLLAEGKKEEARTALRSFMSKHALSPLVHAAHRRLVKLGGEKQEGEYDSLLQEAIASQEAHVRFETSVCGPKALAYLLEKLGRAKEDYRTLAKEAGTKDSGTSMTGLKRVLDARNIESFGYVLNRKDLVHLKAPAIFMVDDHYLVYESLEPRALVGYDTTLNGPRKIALPAIDDPDFQLPVLSLIQLNLDAK